MLTMATLYDRPQKKPLIDLNYLRKRTTRFLISSLIFSNIFSTTVVCKEMEVSENLIKYEEETVSVDAVDMPEVYVDSVSAEGIEASSLSSNFTMPAAFLTRSKLTLNGMRRSVSECTYLVLSNDGDYELTGINGTGGVTLSVNRVSYNGFPAFKIEAAATSETPKGSQKFDLVVKNRYNGISLKKVRLTVNVKKTNPAVKWEKDLVVLNSSVKGDFALNSPNIDGVSIIPLSGNEKYKPSIPAGINITLQNENTIKVTASGLLKADKSYPVQLWLLYADSTMVKAVKKKFRVKITDKEAGVTLKKMRGSSLDLTDRTGTGFHYKPVIKNTGLVLNDIAFTGQSISQNYYIEEVRDPDTKEITDFYVKAKDGVKFAKGSETFGFDLFLQAPRMDAKTVRSGASAKGSKKSSKLKFSFVSGNNLKINETLSDNHVAGTIDVRVSTPGFAVIDPLSIMDLTFDSGKVSQDAFKAYWTVDDFGRAARIRIVVDKNKITAGKTYSLIYSLKAKGAAADAAPSKVTVKFKA